VRSSSYPTILAAIRRLFNDLPENIQRLAEKSYDLWQTNPSHPSLGFRRLEGRDGLLTVRVGNPDRALGIIDAATVTWVWIGTHADYDRLIPG
jgi:hypothetical protein